MPGPCVRKHYNPMENPFCRRSVQKLLQIMILVSIAKNLSSQIRVWWMNGQGPGWLWMHTNHIDDIDTAFRGKSTTEMIHLTRHSLNSTFCLFLNVQKIHLTRHSGKPQENRHFGEWSRRRRWKMGVFERKNPTHLTRHSLNSTKIGILRSDSLNSTSS